VYIGKFPIFSVKVFPTQVTVPGAI
jgi:hypothetical protein